LTTDPFPSPAEIQACLLRDRDAFARRVRGLRARARQGQPFDQGLIKLWASVRESQGILERRRASIPEAIQYPPELPVCERREEIAALISAHQVVVLCGETGSGKSTQLPKLCLDLGRGVAGRIGHTQPRRIAARTLASRVAQELKAELGALVGSRSASTTGCARRRPSS
jgi:ATP-dependent helicase HrpA